MIRVRTYREPTHPGEMLLEEFLEPIRPASTLSSVSEDESTWQG